MRCVRTRERAIALVVAVAAVGVLCLLSSAALAARPKAAMKPRPSQPAMRGAGTAPMAWASNVRDQAWISTGGRPLAPPKQTTASIQMSVVDITPTATSQSEDQANVVARFRYPADGARYAVRFTTIVPQSDAHNHYGGVAIMRSISDLGLKVPPVMAYVAVFGESTITKDGQVIATNQPTYALVTPAWHDDSHQFMSAPDPMRQEISLFAPGSLQAGGDAIPGFPNGYFYIYWPSAAFALRNIGGKVSLTEVGVTIPAPTSGAGPRRDMPTGTVLGTINISLTDTGIRKKVGDAPSGLYDVKVTNNSSRRMGVVYTGTDLCCTKYVRFSDVIRPGQSQTFRWYFAPGKVKLHNYLSGRRIREGYANVKYGRFSSSIIFQ